MYVQYTLDLRKPDLRKNLDLRKIVGMYYDAFSSGSPVLNFLLKKFGIQPKESLALWKSLKTVDYCQKN